MMIRNVIFDVGNVLIEFDWQKFLRNLFDEETAKAVSPAMWGTAAWDEMDRGVLSMDEVTALFIANAPDYEPQIREALDRVSECASVKPYTIGWIRELKAKGFHVYYLSNYFQRIWEQRPDVRAFADETDGGTFSWQEKVIKPSPESFQRLLDRYGLKAEESLFIDDSPKNIAAADALGFHAVRFESYEQQHEQIMEYLAEHTK